MAGISSISGIGAGIEAIRLETEFQALALRRQVDALNLQGDLAIQLIQSAVVTDPSVGQNLDVLA
ncbi:MAG: hypothetical protein IT365_13265 [Candidatus Hydrogenedentes bacterium]|nr:hypothetical protein [Candidatus Hydrogenedentota bacterium]MCC6696594.1 hypothetical protein [Candidatus Hydrogenedentota bacterium]